MTEPVQETTTSSTELVVDDGINAAPNQLAQTFKQLGLPPQIECLEHVGVGGMGSVYKARHAVSGADLAVKILLPKLADDKKSITRFLQEARMLTKLKSRRVVVVHDCGVTEKELPYIIMDFVPGLALDQVIQAAGPMDVNEAVEVFLQCAEGLSEAHKNGIVHRDLKPSNIMVDLQDDGNIDVHLLDFGISKLLRGDPNELNLTNTGDVLGTPLYMSPENCMGYALDGRSDVYSLGCVMFEALTGKPPFEGTDAVRVLARHVRDTVPVIGTLRSDIPAGLQKIISRMLEKDPKDRYQTMEELIADLQQFRSKGTVSKKLSGGQKRDIKTAFGSIVWAFIGFLFTFLIITVLRHFGIL